MECSHENKRLTSSSNLKKPESSVFAEAVVSLATCPYVDGKDLHRVVSLPALSKFLS